MDWQETDYIISDSFWYTISKFFKEGEEWKQIIKKLKDRMAANYVALFVQIPRNEKIFLFQNFFNCVAQTVFISLFYAFPKSRP